MQISNLQHAIIFLKNRLKMTNILNFDDLKKFIL